ncbi:MAG: hypothetical protein Q9170_006656 [Blastenia crenularia]
MDYFIDDMLGSSRRKSLPNSPAALEPPLPPTPTPATSKKGKSVKFPTVSSSSVPGSFRSSKVPGASVAATIPLPDTPAPPTISSQPRGSAPEANLTSPNFATGPVTRSDYFSAAELAPQVKASATLGVPKQTTHNAQSYFTPMSELSQPKEETAAIEVPTEPTLAAEQQQSEDEPGDVASTAKEMPADRADSPPPSLHVLHSPVPVVHNQPAFMIGISGSPASGKTTLAHLLAYVLPPTTPSFIIHQDDFFIRKHLLIPDADGGLDVKYRRTVDFAAFKSLLAYSKREGRLPPGFRSLQSEDERRHALSQVSPEILEQMKAGLASLLSLQDYRPIGIVDGFLLYHSETIRNLLDTKLLLRAEKEHSRNRRIDKTHIHGLGQASHPWDTAEYFDNVIWQNYADEHGVLFEKNDVDSKPVASICVGVGISVQPYLDMGIEEMLQWAIGIFRKGREEAVDRHDRGTVSLVGGKGEHEFCNCNDSFLGWIRQVIFDHI